jgi:uncharacterized FlaG/YvyC family protein
MEDGEKKIRKIEEEYIMDILKNIQDITLSQHNRIEESKRIMEEARRNDIIAPYRERVHAIFEDLERQLEDMLLEIRFSKS